MMSRTVAGFATAAFVGFGALLAAPAALAVDGEQPAPAQTPAEQPQTPPVKEGADNSAPKGEESGLQTLDAEGKDVKTTYKCTFNGQSVDGGDIKVVLNTATSAVTGQKLALEIGEFQSTWYTTGGANPKPADVSASIAFKLGGAAAPSSTVRTTGVGEKYEDGQLLFGPITGALTPKKPGDITFKPGTIKVTVKKQGSTVCEPKGGAVFHTVKVTGDPVDPEPTPTPTEDPKPTPTEKPTTSPKPTPTEDDKPTPAPTEDDNAGGDKGGLPVTGTALGGLIAAGAVAVGGGGAAMYLSRKRRAGAHRDES